MVTRIAFQTAMRAAAVKLLKDYADDVEQSLQVYPGRPLTLFPPTAFVDRIRERTVYTGPLLRQRTPAADIVVIHAVFDSAEAAAKRDAFVDGFMDYVTDRFHAAGANTTIAAVGVEDEPNYIPDWLPPDKQRQYYATVITLEGLALD